MSGKKINCYETRFDVVVTFAWINDKEPESILSRLAEVFACQATKPVSRLPITIAYEPDEKSHISANIERS